jgi:hypothetical protein
MQVPTAAAFIFLYGAVQEDEGFQVRCKTDVSMKLTRKQKHEP